LTNPSSRRRGLRPADGRSPTANHQPNIALGAQRPATKALSEVGVAADQISQRAGSNHYYLIDALGSVTALTNSSGTVTETYKTDPFGSNTGGTGSTWNPWNFAGEYREFATGSYIYKIGARNYDPSLGRWTQQDPLDQPDDLQNANKYAYVAGDPVNHVDPSGTAGFPDLDGPPAGT